MVRSTRAASSKRPATLHGLPCYAELLSQSLGGNNCFLKNRMKPTSPRGYWGKGLQDNSRLHGMEAMRVAVGLAKRMGQIRGVYLSVTLLAVTSTVLVALAAKVLTISAEAPVPSAPVPGSKVPKPSSESEDSQEQAK